MYRAASTETSKMAIASTVNCPLSVLLAWSQSTLASTRRHSGRVFRRCAARPEPGEGVGGDDGRADPDFVDRAIDFHPVLLFQLRSTTNINGQGFAGDGIGLLIQAKGAVRVLEHNRAEQFGDALI